jgi:hypothetical protein
MSVPDFEVAARMRGKSLVARVPPDPATETTGDGVELMHRQTRQRLPEEMEPGHAYQNVLVTKRLIGRVDG